MEKLLCIKSLKRFAAVAASILSIPFAAHAATHTTAFRDAHSSNNWMNTLFVVSSAAAVPDPLVVPEANADKINPLLLKLSIALHEGAERDANGNPKPFDVSVHDCALHVRDAFKKIGFTYGSGNPTDLENALLAAGYIKEKREHYKDKPGNITLTKAYGSHPYGHIAVNALKLEKVGKRWVADKKADPSKNLWISCFGQKSNLVYGDPEEQKHVTVYTNPSFPVTIKPNRLFDQRFADCSYLLNQTVGHTTYSSTAARSYFTMRYLSHKTEQAQKAYFDNLPNGWSDSEVMLASDLVPRAQYDNTPILVRLNNSEKPNDHLPLKKDNGSAETILATLCTLSAVKPKHKQKTPDKVMMLREQWHEVRKAVLKRNAALKNNLVDIKAEAQIKKSVIKMFDYLHATYKFDVVEGFKASRATFNNLKNHTLFDKADAEAKQRKIIKFMSDNLKKIAQQDEKLGLQAAKFIAANQPKRKKIARPRRSTPSLVAAA